MDPRITSKIQAIDIKIKKLRKNYIRMFIIGTIFFLFPLLISYFNILPIISDQINGFYLIGGLIMLMSISSYIDPLKSNDKLLRAMVDSMTLLENTASDTSNRQEAYQTLMNTVKNYSISDDTSWHLHVTHIINKFIENIKTRVAPAILEGKLSSLSLEQIATSFMSIHIEDIQNQNSIIEQNYDEIKYEETGIKTNIKKYLDTKYGKLVMSLLLGYSITIAISYCIAYYINQPIQMFITNNPSIIFIGGTGLSAIFAQYYMKTT